MKQIILNIVLMVALLFQPTKSIAFFGLDDVAGATEFTQILNNLELIAQYEKQVEQYINQFVTFEAMLKNIGDVLPQRQWEKFISSVENMKEIMNRTNKIIYYAENLDTKFRELYQGYDIFLEKAMKDELDLNQVYKHISDETGESMKNSLKALGKAQGDLSDDEGTMKELEVTSKTTEGQLSAIQTANQIALHQTAQLKKLHQTLLIQSQAQFKTLAAEQAKTDAAKAVIEARLSPYSDRSDDRTAKELGGY